MQHTVVQLPVKMQVDGRRHIAMAGAGVLKGKMNPARGQGQDTPGANWGRFQSTPPPRVPRVHTAYPAYLTASPMDPLGGGGAAQRHRHQSGAHLNRYPRSMLAIHVLW